MRLWLLLLAVAALPAAAQNTNDPRQATTHGKSDFEREQEERDFKDGELRFPAAPKAESLIEFHPSSASSFRFFIDAASLSVGEGIVRYTLIARSPNGHDNVTYEGMRCRSNLVRIYGYSNAGAWSRSSSDWKPIEAKTVQRWHNELRGRYFCPLQLPIMSVAEGLDALRRGGHPMAERTASPGRF